MPPRWRNPNRLAELRRFRRSPLATARNRFGPRCRGPYGVRTLGTPDGALDNLAPSVFAERRRAADDCEPGRDVMASAHTRGSRRAAQKSGVLRMFM